MSKEVAIILQIVLSGTILLKRKYIFVYLFTKALFGERYTIFDSSFKRNFSFLRWYVPMYAVFFNLYGWVQILMNQHNLYTLFLYTFLAWIIYILLHLALRQKLLLYACASLLVFLICYALMHKNRDYRVFVYPFMAWILLMNLSITLSKGNLFKKPLYIYQFVVWCTFVPLCFLLPQSTDYEIFLFLYLFISWIAFLASWIINLMQKLSLSKSK